MPELPEFCDITNILSRLTSQVFTDARFLNMIKNRHRFCYIFVRLTFSFHVSDIFWVTKKINGFRKLIKNLKKKQILLGLPCQQIYTFLLCDNYRVTFNLGDSTSSLCKCYNLRLLHKWEKIRTG